MLLKNLISHLHFNSDLRITLISHSSGVLKNSYKEVCNYIEYNSFQKIFFYLLEFLRIKKLYLRTKYPVHSYPLIYSNTIACTPLAMEFEEPGRKIIQHVHELSYASRILQVRENLKKSVSKTHLFIAASHAVARFLKDEILVDDSKIRVIHEFPVSTPDQKKSYSRGKIRNDFVILEDDFLIGMCGTPEWRKGIDLFVQLALRMTNEREGEKYHFLWVGGTNNQLQEARHDVEALGLSSKIHFVECVEDASPYYSAMDLFALTSREDPFSVAMLEAAASGLPIVCFDKAGGGPEFVGRDAGVVVPYIDVDCMADACKKLLKDDQLRERVGSTAKQKVNDCYNALQQIKKLQDLISEVMNQKQIQ